MHRGEDISIIHHTKTLIGGGGKEEGGVRHASKGFFSGRFKFEGNCNNVQNVTTLDGQLHKLVT